MSGVDLLLTPRWVNLLVLIPAVPFLLSGKKTLIAKRRLLIAALFGIAFGCVEAAVVVYLRAATGLVAWPAIESALCLPRESAENRVLPRSSNNDHTRWDFLAGKASMEVLLRFCGH